ncbi:MAG: patatin-like phospholipase family protein [Deltaproteobacteria bacterium]|nr:patatin-like phospholipase family protein [Deltaproteobacteria bacterium]
MVAGQDELFIALAFSGGGTRAAAFSYGALKKLAATPLPGQSDKSILDEVDLISSVSGGSFTAAYFGLFGQEKTLREFPAKFLHQNYELTMAQTIFNPYYFFSLMSPWFDRSDMAAELYGKNIYEDKKFSDLIKRGSHPFIALNATNMYTGYRFTFTQNYFDFLCSRIDDFPVARAVAASSAFPILLTPITLKNYPQCSFNMPIEVAMGLKDWNLNRERYYWANSQAIYRNDYDQHHYLHLVDGGLADNLGLDYILASLARGALYDRLPKIKRLVVITVNSQVNPPQGIDLESDPPGTLEVAFKTGTVSMENLTLERSQKTRERLAELLKKRLQETGAKGVQGGARLPKTYYIELNLGDETDPERLKKLMAIPTSFHLKPSQVEMMIHEAASLLEKNRSWHKLLSDLGASP